ncbi:MAG TPA: hypothetical protein VKR52_04565 [Terracidiphilus sp.]|nr:hypothetical protein [Terracidiphilus sp.]
MQEELKGRGVLRTGHPGAIEWQVTYHFVISTVLLEKGGFPPVAVSSHSLGSVSELNGKDIPIGHYQLVAEGGEILRVKNLGLGKWTILAPSYLCAAAAKISHA